MAGNRNAELEGERKKFLKKIKIFFQKILPRPSSHNVQAPNYLTGTGQAYKYQPRKYSKKSSSSETDNRSSVKKNLVIFEN